jgi:hypothetical protein
MKHPYRLHSLLLGCLLLTAFTLADWIPFSVHERVTVQLPTQPTERDMSYMMSPEQRKHNHVYMARDAHGVYQVVQSATGLSAEKTGLAATRQDFYTRITNGLLRHEQGVLLAQSTFPTAGGEGLETKYKAVDQATGKRAIRYTRNLLIGTTAYSFSFTPLDQKDTTGTSGNEQRRRFFESIVVTPASGK